jgi:hypothetical protein
MDALEYLTAIRDRAGLPSENDIATRTLLRMICDAEKAVAYDAPAYFVRTRSQSITTHAVDVPKRYKKLLLAWLAGKSMAEVSKDEEWLIDNINLTPSTTYPKIIDFGVKLKIFPTPTASTVLVYNYFADPVRLEYGIGSIGAGRLVMDSFAEPTDDYYNDEYVVLYSSSGGMLTKQGRTKITDYVASTRTLTVEDATSSHNTLVYAIDSFCSNPERVLAEVFKMMGLNVPEPAPAPKEERGDNGQRSK